MLLQHHIVFLADTPRYLFGLLLHPLQVFLKCHFLIDPSMDLMRQVGKKNVSSMSDGEIGTPKGKVQDYNVLVVSVL